MVFIGDLGEPGWDRAGSNSVIWLGTGGLCRPMNAGQVGSDCRALRKR